MLSLKRAFSLDETISELGALELEGRSHCQFLKSRSLPGCHRLSVLGSRLLSHRLSLWTLFRRTRTGHLPAYLAENLGPTPRRYLRINAGLAIHFDWLRVRAPTPLISEL